MVLTDRFTASYLINRNYQIQVEDNIQQGFKSCNRSMKVRQGGGDKAGGGGGGAAKSLY